MWWSTMNKDIKEVLDQCKVCDKFKISKSPTKSVIPLVNRKPYEQWAINVISPMPSNTKGCKFIITAINFSTRWLVAIATESHDGNVI